MLFFGRGGARAPAIQPLASYGSFETSSTPDDERESLDTVSGDGGGSRRARRLGGRRRPAAPRA